jgi:putative SOS response-associated peptidase YedK
MSPHRLELLRWGLPKGHGAGINVRVETVARAPTYRESFWKRRCLVVVDGFYEWKKEGRSASRLPSVESMASRSRSQESGNTP